MMKKNKLNLITWQLFAIVGLNLSYKVIAFEFAYLDFTYSFDLIKLILGTILLVIILFLGLGIKNDFLYSVYNIVFLLFIVPSYVFYQYTENSSLQQPISFS